MKPCLYPLLFLVVLFLSGCGMQSRFASSFGKRRYTKGYYFNLYHGGDKVAAKTNPHASSLYKLMKPVTGHLFPVKANVPIIAARLKIPDVGVGVRHYSALHTVASGKANIPVAHVNNIRVLPAVTHSATENTPERNSLFLRSVYFVFFAIALTVAAAVLVLLLTAIGSNSAPQVGAILLGVALVITIGIIILLAALAKSNRISDDLAAPLADFLINVFFAILSAAGSR